MFTAIRAETAHSPTYQLLRGELKKRGGRSPKPRNQVMEWAPSRRVDVASKGQLGELKCEVGLPL